MPASPDSHPAAALFDIDGHGAIVTGAASGLGRAIAEVLAEAGAAVTLADRDDERLHDFERALLARVRQVAACVMDTSSADDVRRLFDAAVSHAGRVDVVFANAGMSAGPGFGVDPRGRLEDVDLEEWNAVVATNLTGSLLVLRAAAPIMAQRGYGRIVVTTSAAGMRGEPLVGYAYAATKAALGNVVRQAALELAPHGVLVNGIAPGPFRTRIGNGRLDDPAARETFAARVPLGRIADPDEIKGLALLLASPASSYITGAVVPIDGGVLAG